jgi:K+-sensing histidine kinase KdpD
MLVNSRYISVKINEPQLRERNEPLFILLSISNFLSTCHDLREVLDGALARVLQHFEFDAGRIYLMDESGESLELGSYVGLDTEGLERVRINEGFTGKAARTRSFIAQYISELEDRHRAELLMGRGFKIIVCVPLIAMSNVVGVMNLAANKVVELDQAKIDLLVSVGNLIAVAANNVKLYADVKRKNKELRAQKKATEFFAHSISHDLKSPTIGIYGLTKRLVRDYQNSLDEKGKLYCNQILKASEQMVKLVDKINAYILAKEAPLQIEQVKLKEALEMVRQEVSEELNRRSIEWLEPADLPVILADKTSLLRVLRNLIGNALKHGGETLRRIEIDYQDSEDHHILRISDDGLALSEEDHGKLFQLFYRHEQSKGLEGAGLGLAIVREIAERHRGKAWIDPAAKHGMTFCVSFSKSLRPDQKGLNQS